MLNVLYSCIAHEHDPRLVALAAVLCVFGCFTSANLFVHARERCRRRQLALVAAAAVFGASVWATHFIAELAFNPGLPLAYDSDLIALSLLIAVMVTAAGMVVAARCERPTAGGLVIGVAVAAMHYTGMAALRIPADISWNHAYVALSLATGALGAGTAFRVLCCGPALRYRAAATALLVLAICGLHFIAMSAVVLVPDPVVAIPMHVVDPQMLAIVVATGCIGIVALGVALSVFEEQAARHALQKAAALRFSREHLARAQRIAGIGSIVRDLRTGVSECSDGFRDIFGIKEKNFEPTIDRIFKFVHPDDLAMLKSATDKAVAELTEAPPIEYRIVRPNGQVRVVSRVMEVLRDAAGLATHCIVTFKDITELRSAQQRERELLHQLMHTQKLESLGTLAGGVAHELNNTLVPILALAQLALAELPPDSSTREDIATIATAAERARDLVSQILAFSRKQDQVRQPTELAPIVHEALQMLRASLPSTIRIIETVEPTPMIYANLGEMHQLVVNLVTNAAQAIGAAQGMITVSVFTTGGSVRLSVADNGCGMDHATQERVFEPFFTTKSVGEGTGLGLSVVHGIVTAHGGDIAVCSTPGHGTTFTITLPAARSQTAPVEALAA